MRRWRRWWVRVVFSDVMIRWVWRVIIRGVARIRGMVVIRRSRRIMMMAVIVGGVTSRIMRFIVLVSVAGTETVIVRGRRVLPLSS